MYVNNSSSKPGGRFRGGAAAAGGRMTKGTVSESCWNILGKDSIYYYLK